MTGFFRSVQEEVAAVFENDPAAPSKHVALGPDGN